MIPIKDSLLYIEPLYIQAEKGQLPELKRILLSDGERVVLEKDLQTGLEKLFDFSKPTSVNRVESDGEYHDADSSQDELLSQVNELYQNIETAMKQGDWTAFGRNFDKLGETLTFLSDSSIQQESDESIDETSRVFKDQSDNEE